MSNKVIEINTYGPYKHGSWVKDSINSVQKISGYEARSNYLLNSTPNFLKENFEEEKLKAMSIIDVGCYDGWLIEKISSNLEIGRLVGVEPRMKNLRKGEVARSALGIQSKVEYIKSGIEEIGEMFNSREFDIVMCHGVLHHIESTIFGIRELARLTKDTLILSSLVVGGINRKTTLRNLAVKDAIYSLATRNYFGSTQWGGSAFKLESSYFDGSVSKTSIVGIPNLELIEMCLLSEGLALNQSGKANLISYDKSFLKANSYSEAFFIARKNSDSESLDSLTAESIKQYELTRMNTIVRRSLINVVLTKLGLHEIKNQLSLPSPKNLDKILYRLIAVHQNNVSSKVLKFFTKGAKDSELIRELSYNLKDKILFEVAKLFFSQREFDKARTVFGAILVIENVDWRAFYRSVFFLSCISDLEGNQQETESYLRILEESCPAFPKLKIEIHMSYFQRD
jgi:2-polyprenyl-3-methyl-5-hydroxy-6-metoxy-1,4-benzoquinol methylase